MNTTHQTKSRRGHSAQARREAAAVPLVLFGEHGRTVEGYRPADEDLAGARAARNDWSNWKPVRGPHLRVVRRRYKTNKTGVIGISVSNGTAGRRVVVQLGSTTRIFSIDTLGLNEALRRAIALRRRHELKLAQANEVILTARARSESEGEK